MWSNEVSMHVKEDFIMATMILMFLVMQVCPIIFEPVEK